MFVHGKAGLSTFESGVRRRCFPTVSDRRRVCPQCRVRGRGLIMKCDLGCPRRSTTGVTHSVPLLSLGQRPVHPSGPERLACVPGPRALEADPVSRPHCPRPTQPPCAARGRVSQAVVASLSRGALCGDSGAPCAPRWWRVTVEGFVQKPHRAPAGGSPRDQGLVRLPRHAASATCSGRQGTGRTEGA